MYGGNQGPPKQGRSEVLSIVEDRENAKEAKISRYVCRDIPWSKGKNSVPTAASVEVCKSKASPSLRKEAEDVEDEAVCNRGMLGS